MSGFFGSVIGLLGGNAHGNVGNLLSQVIDAAGGPAGIAQKFQQAGLGDKVQSWIGNGHNLPVSAEQIAQVFPPAQLDAWAQQHGLPAGVASGILAQFLPHAIDASTPNGTLPSQAPGSSPPASGSNIDFVGLVKRFTARNDTPSGA